MAAARRGRQVILWGVTLLFGLVVLRGLNSLFVDLLWYTEAGYPDVLWKQLAWTWGIRGGAVLLVGVVFLLNLSRVGDSLGTVHIRRRFANLEISEQLPGPWVRSAVLAAAALFGLWFGVSIPDDVGRSALLFFASGPWGTVDPVLGRDLSFHVFLLPLLRAGVTFLLVVAFVLFTICAAGYATTGVLGMAGGGMVMTDGARRHLGTLFSLFLLLVAARLLLGRELLLLQGTSDVQGIFGHTDATARLPGLVVQAALALAGAVAVFVGAWRNRLMPAVSGLVVVVVGTLVVGQVYPAFVQRFQVVPNELARETPWIERNVEFTRAGFGLDAVERSVWDARAEGPVDWGEATLQFSGLPVWSPEALLVSFREIEARFRYYHFPAVALDRYGSGAESVPVAISVREVDPSGIEDPNWQNLHLRERYVTGNGVVAVDALGATPEGRNLNLLSGIPTERAAGAPPGLSLERAPIFYGVRSQPWALITATDTDYLAPDGSRGTPGVDFPGGIEVGGMLRRLLLAWYLGDANLLFSGEVRSDSRLVLHRSVLQRVRRLAPVLSFPETPYPVVHEGRVIWVVEGFTTTRFFPLASTASLEFGRAISYARNSVKATVDAVTGEVDFFAVDIDDPLRDAIDTAFPGLLKPIDEMPAGLREHLRYPRSLMALQSDVLLQYHQDDPAVFFGQQDVWAVPQELAQGSTPVIFQPEYGNLRMPGDEAPAFRLVTAFVPVGRRNLASLLAGELDADGVPRLRLFDVPIENQVPGPRQIEALFEQDPAISQQVSLWRTGGSRVWTGHLHLVPAGDRLVYMEPIFLAAEEDAIPELRRFVVSDGQRVAMEPTLAGAIAALAGGAAAVPTSPEVSADLPAPSGAGAWPADAVRWLDEAERRLRAGDWAGFGEALDRLRAILRDAGGSQQVPAVDPPGGAP